MSLSKRVSRSAAEGKARAGMGVDVADFENSGAPGVAITNFDNEMIGLYRLRRQELSKTLPPNPGSGSPPETAWDSAAPFSMSTSTAGSISPLPMATSTRPFATFAATSDMPSRHNSFSTVAREASAMSRQRPAADFESA